MYRQVPLNYDFLHLQREQVLVQAYLTSKRVKEIGMITLTIKGGTRGKEGQAPTTCTCICDRPNIIKLHTTIIHGRARFDPLPHPGGLSRRGPSRPRLCPERRPQCWSPSYRDPRLLLQVSAICMLSVYLKLTDCLPPPSMRSLELLSYPAYYMPPLHGVTSPQPRIAPELTVSSIELLI